MFPKMLSNKSRAEIRDYNIDLLLKFQELLRKRK